MTAMPESNTLFFYRAWSGLKTRIAQGSDQVQSLVFPPRCLKCRVYLGRGTGLSQGLSRSFCKQCLGTPPYYAPPYCPCCGRRYDAGEIHLCEACLRKPPVIRTVRAAFDYKGIIREAVPMFKYRSRLSLATVFEANLFKAFEAFFKDHGIDRILPVPLHRSKQYQRGFNQSYLLVRNFREIYETHYNRPPQWQVDLRSLVRIRPTPSQTGLDEAARRKNLKKAFQIRQGACVSGAHILLIDDVYTSGATCTEAARTLMAAGAGQVDALVLARA